MGFRPVCENSPQKNRKKVLFFSGRKSIAKYFSKNWPFKATFLNWFYFITPLLHHLRINTLHPYIKIISQFEESTVDICCEIEYNKNKLSTAIRLFCKPMKGVIKQCLKKKT